MLRLFRLGRATAVDTAEVGDDTSAARSRSSCSILLGVPRSRLARSSGASVERASVEPYSATVPPIPTKPGPSVHRSRPRDGSAAISRPGTSHGSVASRSTVTAEISAVGPLTAEIGRALVDYGQPQRRPPQVCHVPQ
ncbi:hypothetical protein THAOC_24486 [Thalassiosira oceanica]|uniref:Uncharacterized protein n=1 Tax=Thalassiosira oceanica TaxID=159749 RepID=K0S499_THAOC|nr:hypothetical protein THAOC_24486 [Thalassiosira oceanica]|eukprot:EJK55746.1 hypothetical protein THAOC_24486 [Thalassiosira oceanica]